VTIRRWTALGLVLLASLGAELARAAPGGTAGVTACALGRATAGEATLEAAVLGAARTRFERSIHGVSPSARAAEGAKFATDLAAYLYGYPIVIQRRTIESYPRNTMVSVGELANTNQQSIVAPNHDTLYSVAQLDLSNGPIVVTTPPTGGRYSVIQLIDGFTNATAYLGDGQAARTGTRAVLVPPGYRGSVPSGLVVIHPATKLVLLLGRTLATGSADTAAAVTLLRRYSVTPLATYDTGTRRPPLVLSTFPKRTPVKVPTGAAFFTELAADLVADPAPAADRCALRAFAAAGVPTGGKPSHGVGPNAVGVLSAAAAQGPSVLKQLAADVEQAGGSALDGWGSTPPDTAEFGTHYADRTVVAKIGLEANTNAKALYLTQTRDATGRSLNGRYAYRVHFAPGQLPPVSEFWSLTLYDSRILFYPNALNRYAIGDRTAGLRRDRKGGLTIVVSHRAPRGANRANWLPAPAGRFELYLRLYQPKPVAAHRHWRPPVVVRT
jgi:hypothetical protein